MRAALGSELAEQLLFASQRAVPQALLADGFRFNHPTVDSCLASVLGRDVEIV